MTRYRAKKREKIERPVCVGDVLTRVLQDMGAKPHDVRVHGRLVALWQQWEKVMGPELAALGQPLENKDHTLFVGTTDAVAAQELHFHHDTLLQRANAFMGQAFFVAVRVELLMGRKSRNVSALSSPLEQGCLGSKAFVPPEPSHAFGTYLDKMDPASVVARAYTRFVDLSHRGYLW